MALQHSMDVTEIQKNTESREHFHHHDLCQMEL
nr:MAG TPA: hypothetical protein [Caudoviricetes sp.]